jgi:phospholipase C
LIEHVFVLMLENRSFDHLLGFSQIHGLDPSGKATTADGLTGRESNPSPKGGSATVSQPADYVSDFGPGHEFRDVREQLCGALGTYSSPSPPPGKVDPRITNDGYISNFSRYNKKNPEAVMKCFAPEQLPVLNALVREFAVADRWFSSMPGPTWPNRFFVHAGSSGGLDDSPSFSRELKSILTDGFKFENGTVFDRLDEGRHGWTIYSDDEFPQALSIAGMRAKFEERFRPFKRFHQEISDPGFSDSYVFIEPDYHAFTGRFRGGNSQHPMDDVTSGERLLKQTYEAIRNSPVWEKSLFIVVYDEHGGFYDHVIPPATTEPGDPIITPGNNHNGFDFRQLGVRVPAVIISPLVRKGIIDHTEYDHTSVLSTVERLFGLDHLTNRDSKANTMNHLITLKSPRQDAPATLPEPAVSGYVHKEKSRKSVSGRSEALVEWLVSLLSTQPVDASLSGFHHVALLRDIQDTPEAQRGKKVDEFLGRKHHRAVRYLRKVHDRTLETAGAKERIRPTRRVSEDRRVPEGQVNYGE